MRVFWKQTVLLTLLGCGGSSPASPVESPVLVAASRASRAPAASVASNHSASTSPTLCINTDNGATDSALSPNTCDAYEAYASSVCGGYDDADFSANDMCCACGGGSARVGGDALLLARGDVIADADDGMWAGRRMTEGSYSYDVTTTPRPSLACASCSLPYGLLVFSR